MSLHDPQDLRQAPQHVIALAHYMRDPGAPAEMVAMKVEGHA
jgi:hypothetical protein